MLRRPAWCCCPAAPPPWLPAHTAGTAAAESARSSLPLPAAAAGPAAPRCCLLPPARMGSDTLGADRKHMLCPLWEQGCVPQFYLEQASYCKVSCSHTQQFQTPSSGHHLDV